MLEVGLKLWSTNVGDYLREAERLYAEGVFDYLELFVVPDFMDVLPQWKRLHDALHMPCVVHNAHFAAGFNLADTGAEARNREIFMQTRAFADALDARYIIFHGGVDGSAAETARQLKSLSEPRALLENTPCVPLPNRLGAKACRCATEEEIALVTGEAGCGFCLDVGHAVCAANSLALEPYAYVERLNSRFSPRMYHLSDVSDIASEFDAHPHLGTGRLDLKRIVARLMPDGSMVSVETEKSRNTDLQDFEEDVRWLRNFE